MHHHAAAAVLDLLGGLKASPPLVRDDRLWLVALHGLARHAGSDELTYGAGVEFLEDDPPAPDRIVAVNHGPSEAVVFPGDAVAGGLAGRIVTAEALIPPRAHRLASADPLVITAIELLRRGDGPGSAALIRTALWSVDERLGLTRQATRPADSPPLQSRGWAIGDHGGVLGVGVYRLPRELPAIRVNDAAAHIAGGHEGAAAAVDHALGQLVRAARRGGVDGGVSRIGDLWFRLLAAGGRVLGVSLARVGADVAAPLWRSGFWS